MTKKSSLSLANTLLSWIVYCSNCNTLRFVLLNPVVLKINIRLHLNMKCNWANAAQKRRKYLYAWQREGQSSHTVEENNHNYCNYIYDRTSQMSSGSLEWLFCGTEAIRWSCGVIVAHHITSVFLLFTGFPAKSQVFDCGWHATPTATRREAWWFWGFAGWELRFSV